MKSSALKPPPPPLWGPALARIHAGEALDAVCVAALPGLAWAGYVELQHGVHVATKRGEAALKHLRRRRRSTSEEELNRALLEAPSLHAQPRPMCSCGRAAAMEASPAPPAPDPKPRTCRNAILNLLAEQTLPQQEIHTGHAEGIVKGTLCKLEREGLVERYTAPVTKGGRDYQCTWWRLVAEEAPAPAPTPETCEVEKEIPSVSQPSAALSKLTPTAQLPPALRRGGGAIVRLVESYGFRLEEHPVDIGAMTVHPRRKGSKAVGQIGFDGDGMLTDLTWEAEWSRLQYLLLVGVSADQLESWLVVGEAGLKRSKEASKTASKTASSPGPRNMAAIERAVVEFGCRLEEVPDDPSKRLVRSSSPSTPLMGTLDFNDRGDLVCCAWDLPWTQERAFSLSGLSADELKAWLRKSRKPADPAPEPEPTPAPPEPTPPPLEEPAWSGARLIDLLATAPPVPLGRALSDLAGAEKRGLVVERDATRQAKTPGTVNCWKIATPGYLGGRIIIRVEEWPDGYDVSFGAKGVKQHAVSRAAAMELVRGELAKGRTA